MANQIKTGIVLSYVQMGLSSILRLVYTPFLLSRLGISGYGIYSLALSVIGYLTVLDFGFNNAAIRFTTKLQVRKEEFSEKELLGLFLLFYIFVALIALIAGGVFSLLAGDIYGEKFTNDELSVFRVVVLILAVNLSFSFPLSIYKSVITSYEKFIFLKVTTIVYEITNVTVMGLILFFGGKVIALSIGITIVNLLLRMSELLYCRIVLKTRIKINLKYVYLFKTIFLYSVFVFLGSIGNQMYKNGSQLLLGATSGPNSVALFALAIQIEAFFISISLTFTSVFLPKLTRIATENNNKEISGIFLKVGRLQYIILQWIFLGFVLLGKPFIMIWGGSEYKETYYIVLLLLMPLLYTKSQNLGKIILQAKNTMQFPYTISFVIAPILSLACAYPISIRYGAIGCAFACAIGMTLAEIVFLNIYYHLCHGIDMIGWWKNTLKLSMAPISLTVLFYYFYSQWSFGSYAAIIGGAVLFSLAYFAVISFFLNDYEKTQIKMFYDFAKSHLCRT